MASGPDVLSIGMIVADHVCAPVAHLPVAGELVTTDEMLLTIGGGACNVAVDLAKMNVRVAINAGVGDDSFGRLIRDMLAQHPQIDLQALKVSPTQPTSQTLIVNVAGQDRRFIHLIGAYGDFTAADIPLALVRSCKVLYVGYFLIMPSLRAEGLIPVFQEARQNGTKVVVDVAVPGQGDHAAKLAKLLPYADVFLPNQDEAAVILNEHEPIKQAQAFREMGAGTVIITRGKEGAVLLNERTRLWSSTYPVEFVDGSGGGDAFAAGYVYGLLKNLDERGCLQVASALGASCVRQIGTTPGVFTERECEEFLGRHVLRIEEL